MSLQSKTKTQLISEIKKLEKKLLAKTVAKPKDEKSKWELYYKYSNNIIAIVNRKGIFVEVNRVVKGLKKSDVIGKSIYNFIDSEYKSIVKESITKTFRYKKQFDYKSKGTGPSGGISYYYGKITPLFENGLVDYVAIDIVDVTNEENITKALKQSENRYKSLADSALEGIVIHQAGKVIQVNKATTKIFKYSEKEIIGVSVFKFIAKEYHEEIKKKLANKDEKTYEMQMLRKGGVKFWAELKAKEIEYNGERARVVAIRDIDQKKEYEQKIKESEERYRMLTENAVDIIARYQIYPYPKHEYISPSCKKITGYSPSEFYNDPNLGHKIIHPDYLPQIKQLSTLPQKQFIKKMKEPFIAKWIRKDGKIIWIETIRNPIFSKEGRVVAIESIGRDVTSRKKLEEEQIKIKISEKVNLQLKKEVKERKAAEEKAFAQAAMLSAILESSAHLIWTMNKKGQLIAYNNNFKKFIEKRYKIKIKKGDSMITGQAVSTASANQFWLEKFKATFSGEAQHFSTNLIGKFNKGTWIEVFFNPIYDDKGNVKEVSGIAHDITDQYLIEKSLKQSLNEKEILLKEVHHRVKNNLQLVSSILNLQSSYVKDEKVVDVLKDSQNRIKSMSFIHESLYRTKNFANINFAEYVSEIAKNLVHSYMKKDEEVKLKLDIQNVFLNLDIAIPCGLIINEILSNALKYAFDKRNINKQLIIDMKKINNVYVMHIGDNGKGLPKGVDFKNTDSLGLQIVTTLADQIGGEIELDKNKIGVNYTLQFSSN